MKIAALYDIHGNLPALNAVISELDQVKPDLIIVGGDIVAGPMPVQTLERLLQLKYPVKFIRGNNDREVVVIYDGKPLRSDMSEKGREKLEWVAKQLNPSHRDFLAQLPERLIQPLNDSGREILFCHATPTSDEEIFTPITPMERLKEIFREVNQPDVVCGHTHIQFEIQIDGIRVMNAGSVGMPFAERSGAYWLLITPSGFEHKCTLYDLENAANEIRASQDPQANDFAEKNVLTIPTPVQAMDMFERLRTK
ncbi:metallophosphoesterase family protein [Paenibacillus ihbetae]|uniref:Phosphoesterase n=1 Tax=Paenibacillus ihbetae TaxID=1870820 RepID=A0ABX3JYV5_9BACL|nr:metallophosphoesterase family protein [Paenibacillus ihbetae]OOC61578.1 phosphoesterase [Paenibacillus ihbetae]